MFYRLLPLITFVLFCNISFSQISGTPDPCTDGTENTCNCDTAPVQCNIGDLDGFTFSMTEYLHPNDGPDPMCSGSQGNNTTSHNPTWFAFLAWCEDLTLDVTATNCEQNPNSCNSLGIQAAVYEDCSLDPDSAIACDTDTQGCEDDYTRTINITGMTIGNTYYFLVDGCCGSYCDILIEVIGDCGLGDIGPWTQEIQGECIVCPDELTQDYSIDTHPGAVNYYWYLDDVEITSSGQPALNETITFDGPGEYEICIDVDNKPCILETSDPEPLCKTVTVLADAADAGDIAANPNPTCPDETIQVNITGFLDDPDFEQWIIAADDAGVIIQADEGSTGSYTADECITYTIYSYNFYADSIDITPIVGENVSDFMDCVACLCDFNSLDISWEDNEAPTFDAPPPATATTDCVEAFGPIGELSWTDNCLGTGMVLGVETGTSTPCDGGELTRTWTMTDSCGNTVTYSQIVTVTPIPEAAFIDVPADENISCADQLNGDVDIDYTNSSTGTCLISGTITGTTPDAVDICGGDLTYTWEFTDQCMRTITHTQVVTIDPPLPIAFLDVPDDVTITCDDLPFTPADLDYTNMDVGDCLREDTGISPTSVGMLDICGDVITYTWSITDDCNRTFDTMQVVTLEDTENPVFTTTPDDITYDCYSEVPVAEDLEWTDNCDGSGLVAATETGTIDICTGGEIMRTWTYTDMCDLEVTYTQTINVDPRPDVDWVTALPMDVDVICGEAIPPAIELEYTNGSVAACLQTGMITATEVGTHVICGDQIVYTWEFTPECGDVITHTQTITLIDTEFPVFTDPPGDEIFDCYSQVPASSDLEWTDNCDGMGVVSVTETGSIDNCTGGEITRTWTYTDMCDNNTTHTQVITVNPRPDVDWTTTLPTDVDVICGEPIPAAIELEYTNGSVAACLQSGTITATEVGELLICEDQIVYTWEFTPECGDVLSHTQTITLIDTEFPVFTDPPGDETFDCYSQVPASSDLEWTDNCDGMGVASVTETGSIDNCTGGEITRTWTYTDMCDNNTTHTQVITVIPRPDVDWTTALPADVDVICGEPIPAAIELEYTNGSVDDCLQSGTITATEVGELLICEDQIVYTWEFTPECGDVLTHTQTITLVDTEFPVFTDPPADETYDCYSQVVASTDLEWTDNCDGTGIVSPTETGSIDICTGGEVTRTWEYTDMCGNTTTHTQVATVNPRPDVAWLTALPTDLTVNCGDMIDPAIPLDYSNMAVDDCLQEGTIDAMEDGTLEVCGDEIVRTWEFTPECGPVLTHTQTITLQDIEFPEFVDPPADETLDCYLDVIDGEDLTWTDNCDGTGMVSYTETGVVDDCDGGELTRTWTYTDMCDNETTHEQIITVTPTPEAEFVNPPADETVICAFTPTMAADLMYTNAETNNCLIEGTVTPTMSGSADQCGGEIIFTWEETDQCDRVITHTQTVTVEPTPEAIFIDPPDDITVECENLPATFDDLMYTNNELDDCLIAGMVSPTQAGNVDGCGGELIITWEFTDACNRTIIHEQIITVDPAPEAAFTDFPDDITINCNEVLATPPSLDYTNSLMGDCQIEGTVVADQTGSTDECGGTIIYNWEFTDDCNRTISYSQTVTVEPAPQADFLDFPDDTNITCDQLPYNAPSINYTNNETGDCEISGSVNPTQTGSADECGGLLTFTWSFTDDCNRTIIHIQNITVDPAAAATFDNPPADITVSCAQGNDPIPSLSYSNGASGVCEIEGNATPTITGSFDLCGGEFIVFWEFVDACDQVIDHTQVITVDPSPEATFINVPADDVIGCDEVSTTLPELIYDNGEDGICEIQGTVVAFQSGSYDECGGVILYSWTYTDDCGRTITASQEISILAAPAASFLDVPDDITVLCDEPDYVPSSLDYTNGETGVCEISGSDAPSEIVNGNVITYLWSYTDPCSGITTEETQVVTVAIEPDIEINPASVVICAGEEYDLNDVMITELNGSSFTYTWHTNNPPTNGNEIDDNLVSPTVETVYYVEVTNEFDCVDLDLFIIEVDEPVFAGDDGSGSVCSDETNVNLFDFLNNVTDFSGIWTVPAGSGINTGNPMSVDFSIVPPGTYDAIYTIISGNSCPEVSAIATIEVFEPLEITIADIECSMDQQFYTITINTAGATITVNAGTLDDPGTGIATISDIPISTAVTIDAIDANNCTDQLIVNPPNCDCPDIEPPLTDVVDPICGTDSPITLSVTVGTDETANWYDSPSGGTLLAGMTLTYQFTETAPGTYTYYVETQSTIFPDCVSLTLTEVVVQIADNPDAQNATLSECDDDDNGITSFDLTAAETSIGGLNSYTYAYFISMADANANSNPLPTTYQNTTPNNQTIFVLVTNPFGCQSIVELTLEVLGIPVFNSDITGEVCLGDESGSVSPNVSGGSGIIELSIDGVTYAVVSEFTNLAAGDYTIYAIDENQCMAQQDITIPEGLEVLLDAFTFACSDSGTDTDPADDIYNVDFNLSTNLGGMSYTVYLDNIASGTFNYGAAENIQLPADGSTITIRFEDDATGCFIEQIIGPLNPCSTNCTVDFTTLDVECNGNGTASDPTDDFYDITINVTGANTSSNNTYNVLINGTVTYNFTYDQDEMFTLPADGTSPVITIVDNEDNQCQNNMTIGPLTSCSDLCFMTVEIVSVSCDSQGTENDISDDTYTVEIIVSGANIGSGWTAADGSISGNYDETITLGPFLITDGDLNIEIVDNDDSDCLTFINVPAPVPCSAPCEIEMVNLVVDNCDVDVYSISFQVNVNDGMTNQYIVEIGMDQYGPFMYGQNVTIDNLPADGAMLTAIVTDITFGQCETMFDFTQNIPSMNPETSPAICFGGDTGFVIPNPSGGSGILEVSIDGINYAQVDSFTNLIAGDYTIYTIDENLCIVEQDITILDGLNVLIDAFTFACSDNGTNTDPADDIYNVDFTINTSQGGGTYTLYLDNIASGTFNYGAAESIQLPADGSTITIRFEDDATGCFAEQIIGPLNSCSTDCTVDFTTLDVMCNGNGTASDPSDDYYVITINVVGANSTGSTTYDVLINGTVTYTYTYNVDEMFTLPADGTSPVISIVDTDDIQCQNNMTIGPLNTCSDLCFMLVDVASISCDNQGTENDITDDTYTIEISVSGENIGTTWSSTDGSFSGNYDETITFGPFLITDGDLNIEIFDNDDNDCSTFIDIPAPPPCSAPCDIEMVNLNVGDCDDNNTGMIETDDFYAVSFQVNVTDGTTDQFMVDIGMTQYGPFMYGQIVTIDNLPADGSMLMATVTDISFGQCVTMFDFTSPMPCSSCDQTVDAGNPVQLDCSNSSTILMANASETATYEWNGPNFFFADTQDATVGAPGVYIVEALFTDGCIAIDSVEITVDDDIPIANAGPDLFITCEVDEVTFTAIVGNLLNIEIIWTDANGMLITNDQSFTTDVLGTYNLQLVDTLNNCSSAIDEVNLTENTDEPLAIIYADPGNQIDCIVASITLTNEQQEGVVYNWTFNGNATDAIPLVITEPGLIQLYALDTLSGCIDSSLLDIVDIQDFPIAMINPSDTLDCINDVVTLTAFDQQIDDNIIYNWFDEDYNPIATDVTMIQVMSGGLYYLEAIDTTNNCFNNDSAFVETFLDLPQLEAGQDQILGCGETQTDISASLVGNLNDFDIQWTSTSGTITTATDQLDISVDGEGLYIISVFNNITSCETADTVLVTITEELGNADLTIQDVNCHGENNGLVMIDVTGGVAPYTYSLNGGGFVLDESFDDLPPGDYTLDIMDVNGCSLETSFTIEEPDEIDITLSGDVEITVGDQTQLLAEVNFDDISSIVWTPSLGLSCTDCLDPIASPTTTTNYTITVTDSNGCKVSATVQVRVQQIVVQVYIPNIISANGDNNNDRFLVFGDANVELIEEMFIFDRWGELVYSIENVPPNDPTFGWDGTFKQKPVVPGVYVYLVKVRYVDQTREDFKGNLTVIE